jgi:hypothetical protein
MKHVSYICNLTFMPPLVTVNKLNTLLENHIFLSICYIFEETGMGALYKYTSSRKSVMLFASLLSKHFGAGKAHSI